MLRTVATVDARDIFTRYGRIVRGGRRWMRRSRVHVKALGYACFCNNGRSSRILPTRSSSSTRSISCAD
jgi:hypothetical protein